ncbi:MAG: M20/M25/M40 family metallo-hydrolase, partial [Bdellovibrionales bacterium]|nr:M20/M25/M40 family metallo-hydrolase [Bdellovibrionales bacterium]
LLESLRRMPVSSLDINFIVIVSANEELGSPGFNQFFKKIGQDAHAVFGFEPSMPNGDIIVARNGNYWLEVEAKGIEAHSGRCKGEELNIAHDFIIKFNEIIQLQKKYPSVKMNIGSLKTSKDVFNIVCGDLSCKIDFRYSIESEFQKFLVEVKDVFMSPRLINNEGNAGSVVFSVHDHCPPLEKNKTAVHILESYVRKIESLERRQISLCHSGGAADANYLSSGKSFCADGFGPVGGRLHRMNEYVVISSLATRAEAFANFILTLTKSRGSFYGNPFSV